MAHASEATLTATKPGEFQMENARGTPGFFRAAPDANGRWWLLDADDRPFFCKAVQGVRESAGHREANGLPVDAAARLRRWGFNAVGAGGDGAGREDGLAFMASVDFCRAGALIHAPGVRLPDVFAPDWPERAATRAVEACVALAGERGLIGWLTDDRPDWGQNDAAIISGAAMPGADPAGHANPPRPTLLQICLSLEPAFAAYHAAWEFILALHGGKLDAIARAWSTPLANKEIVRERTRAEQGLATRGYLRDHARWTAEFARRYFTDTAAAIRAVDPHHLVLGCHCAGPVGASVLHACRAPNVDVALTDWRELPPPHPSTALRAGARAAEPVLAANLCWADRRLLSAPASSRGPGLTTVERMLRRGRAVFARTARHPAVCGYVWPQWLDEPGEQPPFARGLVHGNGAEAREHTELLADLNARAETMRRATPAPVFSRPT